jgi:sialate O-acetylesterase
LEIKYLPNRQRHRSCGRYYVGGETGEHRRLETLTMTVRGPRFGAAAGVLLACATPASSQAATPPLLNPLFTDHAVLQRDQPIRIWGQAQPGEAVTVSLAKEAAWARANPEGHWQVVLPRLAAGGPYVLSAAAASGARQLVNDVLVGDVWLCSGQSNMVLPVRSTLDADSEIASASNDTIRMLTIPNVGSPMPLASIAPASWLPTSPATVGEFSAACFYFARELQKTVRVPMGLINASWGGSKIRTWLSAPALRTLGGFDEQMDTLALYARDPHAAALRFGAAWENWWKSRAAAGAEPWRADFDDRAWPPAPPQLGEWDDWGIPQLVNRTGMVWYGTSVKLTPAQAAQATVLTLGETDDLDATWVNGQPAGAGWGGDRSYALPAGILHAGDNSIAVNVFNTYMRGGLVGPPSKQALHFADGTAVPLAGWRYQVVPQSMGAPPRAPWEPLAGYSVAYNGMIAPLVPYNFRGVLWYQGESDTGGDDTARYRSELTALLADWRGQFGPLPFLVAQLPGYGMPPTKPVESGWSDVREAQRKVVARDANAALAVTIDIGDRYDVHPANKQEVGRRLARAARHLIYGEHIVPGGPVAQSGRATPDGVVVHFADAEGGLVSYSASMPIGFELCGANSCQFAQAQIRGADVLLTPSAGAMHVRYCWGDAPVCTLFDGASLPAGPFDLPIESAIAK